MSDNMGHENLLDLLNVDCEEEEDLDDGAPQMLDHSPYYSNADAVKVISSSDKSLNVLSLNCQSLYSKFDSLNIYLNYYSQSECIFHIICLQETWLSADHDINPLQIDGYNLVHKPKIASQHGGVAFYIKDTLNFQILPLVINDNICDSLFIEVQLSDTVSQGCGKVILGNVYRPPRDIISNYSSFTENIEQLLLALQNCPNVMILGDFNIDLLKIKEKEHISTFLYTMISDGFYPKITLPTRRTSISKTLIDNCFVKSLTSLSATTSGILLQNLSDHNPYFVCFKNLQIPCSKKRLVKSAVYTPAAIANFKNELANAFVIDSFKPNDPNYNYDVLHDVVNKLITKHFPIKLVKYRKHRHKNSKWITRGIINSIKFRDALYKKLTNTPILDPLHHTLKTNLNTYNRILKKMIRNAKLQYYQSKLNKNKKDIKKTWECIKDIIGTSSKTENELPDHFIIENEKHTDPKRIANAFNNYYVNVGKDLADKITPIENTSFTNFLKKKSIPEFSFQNVNEKIILQVINNLKPKTSQGMDNMSNKLLKQIKDEIVKPLTIIINQTLNTGIFPDKLKIAKVLPIHKKGDINLIDNYRPISLLPSLSKVFERIMHQQLVKHFDDNKLFYKNQYGFRTYHSTEMAVLELVDRITCALDNKHLSLGIFLDLSKAFDTLDHYILLDKLKHYGIRGTALKLFETYLLNRSQIVNFKNVISEKLAIKTGVPQGSILGPLLFIIYLNDIAQACSFFHPITYADDTALFTALEFSLSNNQNSITDLNTELEKINVWFKVNKLSLNRDKTKAMLFHTVQKNPANVQVSIDGKSIEFVKEFKYLGITLDTHLSWKPHITQLAKKISRTNGILSRLKHFLPLVTLKMIYNSLILPYLSFGVIVWGTSAERLVNIQKKSVRLIANSKYNAHTNPIFKSLSLLKIDDIYLLQLYKFTFKLENKTLPGYFSNQMFVRNNEMHTYDTRNADNFRIPLGRHALCDKSIRYIIPDIYNTIPDELKEKINTHSLSGFSRYAKNLLIDKYETDCTIEDCPNCEN